MSLCTVALISCTTCSLQHNEGLAGCGQERYTEPPDLSPEVLLQAVDHAPRVHLDIETDDQGAEATRLAALGAERIGAVRSWTVMQAPTGHRFCLVGPQGEDFPGAAADWP